MLGRVVVENGVKKLVPLTADCGSGNPCGAIITVYQNTVPNGYLPLGAQFDIAQFPVLYSILGTDTIPTASALGLPTLTTGQYVIKATSGINENQADNVLNILQPVDTVAVDNMHSVTSNAVASAMKYSLEIEENYGIATYGNHYELTINISQKVLQGYRLASWIAYTGLQDYSDINLYYLNYSMTSPNPRLILQIRGVPQYSSPLRIDYVLVWYKPIL